MKSRRDFIKLGSAASLSGLAAPALINAKASALNSDIYVATHQDIVSGSSSNYAIDYDLVKQAIDCCIKEMTGKATAGQAWEDLFPGIDPSKKVAIKVNIWTVHPVQWEVLKAVSLSLTEACNGSFPIGNISIHDNNYSGMTNRVQGVYGSKVTGLGVVYADPSPMYANTTVSIKNTNMRPHRYLDEASYAISIAPLRYLSGREDLTGVCKNMMGAFSSSTTSYSSATIFHDETFYPSFGQLWDKYISTKPFVFILDALLGAKWQQWTHVVKQIIVGQDAAAVDSYGAEILRDICGYGSNRRLIPRSIENAGYGTINYIKHDVEVTSAISRNVKNRKAGGINLSIMPQPVTSSAQISFQTNQKAFADLSIHSISGKRLITLYRGTAAKRSLHWNGRDRYNRPLASGTYVCRLRIGNRVVNKKIAVK